MNKTVQQIELSQIQLRYQHTRIQPSRAVWKMADSIERLGQLSPVSVVQEEACYVLVDGYLRVAALQHCARDTVDVRVWDKPLPMALIELLGPVRHWEPIEEAELLRELHLTHQMSQSRMAQLLGKDPSWVSRRLALLELLDGELRQALFSGVFPAWAASRILVPMARANPEHAQALVKNLRGQIPPTRDLMQLFQHYQKSNRKARERLVHQPALFLKTLQHRKEEQAAKTLKAGAEGQWRRTCMQARELVQRLCDQLPQLIQPEPSTHDCRALLRVFDDLQETFSNLQEALNAYR
jgi:ParB-like chromosome segregation protein Spo0J